MLLCVIRFVMRSEFMPLSVFWILRLRLLVGKVVFVWSEKGCYAPVVWCETNNEFVL